MHYGNTKITQHALKRVKRSESARELYKSDRDDNNICEPIWPSVKPVLNWANVCSPNRLRTVRRTMIRFLI